MTAVQSLKSQNWLAWNRVLAAIGSRCVADSQFRHANDRNQPEAVIRGDVIERPHIAPNLSAAFMAGSAGVTLVL